MSESSEDETSAEAIDQIGSALGKQVARASEPDSRLRLHGVARRGAAQHTAGRASFTIFLGRICAETRSCVSRTRHFDRRARAVTEDAHGMRERASERARREFAIVFDLSTGTRGDRIGALRISRN